MSVSEVTSLAGIPLTQSGIGENRANQQQQPVTSTKLATGSDMRSTGNNTEVAREIGQVNFQEIVAKINRELDLQSVAREFRVDKTLGRTVVRIYDKDTGDLIREVPPEHVAQLSRQARKLMGILMELKA